MGIIDGAMNVLGGVLTMNPVKAVEGVIGIASAPLQAAQSLLLGGGQQQLTGGGSSDFGPGSQNMYGAETNGQF